MAEDNHVFYLNVYNGFFMRLFLCHELCDTIASKPTLDFSEKNVFLFSVINWEALTVQGQTKSTHGRTAHCY